MSLQEIVNVQITRETRSVTRAGFGTPLILGPNLNSANRVEYFTDSDSVADACVGGENSPEYKATVDCFSQSPRVERIAIGQVQGTKTIESDSGTYTAGSIKATVNGEEVVEPYDTDKSTTLTNLASSIQALDDVLTAVYSSGDIIITPITTAVLAVSTDISSITGTLTLDVTASATETVDTALGKIQGEDDDWYGICAVSRVKSDQLLIASWTESHKKVFACASDEQDIVDKTDSADTTSIAAQIKAAAYARTICIYHSQASSEYADAAFLGKVLPYDPGTYTGMFKTLASITVDTLTATQSKNARDKNCNTYEQIGGVNITREGTMAEGEFFDIIVFVDWLDARITEDVYSVLVNQLKVPFTQAGMSTIATAIESPLKVGQNRGGISPLSFDDTTKNQNGGYVIQLPKYEDIPQADKVNRELNDVKFTAWLAGAIHATKIDGVVTL